MKKFNKYETAMIAATAAFLAGLNMFAPAFAPGSN